MAAMVGPVGVDHADLGDGGISGIVTILPRPITIVTEGYYGVYDGIERSFSWWLDTSRGVAENNSINTMKAA